MTTLRARLLRMATLWAIVFLSFGLVYLFQKRSSTQSDLDEQSKKLFNLPNKKDISAMTLTSEKGIFKLERGAGDNDQWHVVVGNQKILAETSTVDAVLSHMMDMKREHEVGEKDQKGKVMPSANLELFGLAEPTGKVEIVTTNQSSQLLLVGKKNNFDGSIYVKLTNSPMVALVPGALEYQVEKTLFDLREKRLLQFETAAVKEFSVVLDTGVSYDVVRDNKNYRLKSRGNVLADKADIDGILSAVANARASAFISENNQGEIGKQFGFHKPKATVTLWLKQGVEPYEIWLSTTKKDGAEKYYATTKTPGQIIELSSNWVLGKLEVTPEELRDQHVLPFDAVDVTQLRLKNKEHELLFVKSVARQTETWHMEKPQKQEVDTGKITAILYKLSGLQAKKVVIENAEQKSLQDKGLIDPMLTIEVYAQEQMLGTLMFGQVENGEQYVNVLGQKRIDTIDPNVVKEFSFESRDYFATKD